VDHKYRRIGSVKNELLKKSREVALAAVQIFNNPSINFKAETYVVLMIIAWTYLLHAYFREKKIEYRYFEKHGKRQIFCKTKHGADKYWSLSTCLDKSKTLLDKHTLNNLRFLIGLRNEIEHQMTSRIDDTVSAYFQACCLNYNEYIKKLFGDKWGIGKYLSFSLQFSSISAEQKELLEDYPEIPAHIRGYIKAFNTSLTEDEFSSPHYAYRIFFTQKHANRKEQADRVIEFVKGNSPLAQNINKEYAHIKETEKRKYLPKQIVEQMKNEGFASFSMHHHTKLWKHFEAKDPSKGYGIMIAGKTWYWYESWVETVREHCIKEKLKYR